MRSASGTTHEEDEARELLSDDQVLTRQLHGRGFPRNPLRLLALVPLCVGAALLAASRTQEEVRHVSGEAAGFVNHLENKEEELLQQNCGNSPLLNEFDSERGMESAGWWFNWTDDFTFKPLMYKDFVPPNSYWGFKMHGSGAISLRVKGEGTMTLDFGNLLGTPGSQVSVYLNLDQVAIAGPSVLSKTVSIPFHNADALTIVQDNTGIIVINQISFECVTTTTTAPSTSLSSADEEEIHEAEERFKSEHSKLQKAALLAEKRQQEHYAAVKLEKAQELIMKKDEKVEEKLKKKKGSEERSAKHEKEQEQRANDRLVKALMDVLDNEENDADLTELVPESGEKLDSDKSSRLSDEEDALRAAEEQEKLAKELELAAKHDGAGREEDLAEAEALEKAAKAEEQRSREKLAKAHNISVKVARVKRNESWAKELMKHAKEQADRTEQELEAAEEEEDRQAKLSAQAAKEMKDALKKHTKKADNEADEAEEKQEKMDEREEEAAEELAESMSAVQPSTTTTTTIFHISLYCYALMLPFGYEPNLLAAQKQKGVGIFECDGHTVFTNSSVMLDSGDPAPLEVELLDFSLAVPYGGKWHTALNTPIFNKIWQKVRTMGIYLAYDWVVKADPDTVWFPSRLLSVLRTELPSGSLRKLRQLEQRRRLQEYPSEGCKTCRLQGHEGDTCDSHVQWLQANQQLTCEQALARTARAPPVDCGCNCTRLEACDLSSDPDWRQDGRFIKGDFLSEKAAIYINNCRFGLHGPIEVLSSAAVTAYVDGLPQCDFLKAQPWGEDKYLDRCMLALGVTRVNVFGMLSEIACGEEPAPCGGPDVAFHPFKKFEEYFACWAFARSFGHGPADADGESEHDGHGTGKGERFI